MSTMLNFTIDSGTLNKKEKNKLEKIVKEG